MRKMVTLGGVALAAMAAAMGLWFVQGDARSNGAPAAGGVVVVHPAASPSPAPAAMPAPVRATKGPALPDVVVAHVRQAYPLLDDVGFSCDAGGCAVTATIPPPTGDAFLQKRQEMLLGGLAKVIEAEGYRTSGPVQMDEVAFNTFRIRAAVAQPQAPTM